MSVAKLAVALKLHTFVKLCTENYVHMFENN